MPKVNRAKSIESSLALFRARNSKSEFENLILQILVHQFIKNTASNHIGASHFVKKLPNFSLNGEKFILLEQQITLDNIRVSK